MSQRASVAGAHFSSKMARVCLGVAHGANVQRSRGLDSARSVAVGGVELVEVELSDPGLGFVLVARSVQVGRDRAELPMRRVRHTSTPHAFSPTSSSW